MANRLRFTDNWLRTLRGPKTGRDEYSDSAFAGLQLRVTDKGTKTFSVVYWSATGKTERRTLGRYPKISLREARAMAAEVIEANEDRAEEEEEEEQLGTVEDLFKEVIASMRAKKMRSAGSYEYDLLTGAANAADALGRETLARDVTPEMVTKWLRTRVVGVGSGMDHARAHCSAAFTRGIAMDHDPMRPEGAPRYGIKSHPVSIIPTAGSTGRARNRVLDMEELRLVWHAMGSVSSHAMAGMFRLLIGVGGVRVTEVLESERSWWTLGEEPVLTLPDTKMGREHDLPLPEQALPPLRLLMALSQDVAAGWPDPSEVPWLIPGEGKQGPTVPINIASVSRAARRMIKKFEMEPWQPRDIRRSMKTHLIDLGLDDRDVDFWHDHGKSADVARKHYDRARRWKMKLEVKAGIEDLLSVITQPLEDAPPVEPTASQSTHRRRAQARGRRPSPVA